MAMLFDVVYPGGERSIATGYPDQIVTIRQVPCGPEACFGDELELDFRALSGGELAGVLPVLRVAGGPRRPTIHVRVVGGEVARELWMDARETEGWLTGYESVEPDIVWVVANQDGLDTATLTRGGGVIIARGGLG